MHGVRGQEHQVVQLLSSLDAAGIAVSAGSACSAIHSGEPSSVVLAMGHDRESARGLVRVSLGRFNTEHEVDRFVEILVREVKVLRAATRDSELSVTAHEAAFRALILPLSSLRTAAENAEKI